MVIMNFKTQRSGVGAQNSALSLPTTASSYSLMSLLSPDSEHNTQASSSNNIRQAAGSVPSAKRPFASMTYSANGQESSRNVSTNIGKQLQPHAICSCLINALREGNIFISYHTVDEKSSTLSPAFPMSYLRKSASNTPTSMPQSFRGVSDLKVCYQNRSAHVEPISSTINHCTSSALPFEPIVKRWKTEESLSSFSRVPPKMETAQRSYSLENRLVAVLERNHRIPARGNFGRKSSSIRTNRLGQTTLTDGDTSSSSNSPTTGDESISSTSSSHSPNDELFELPFDLDEELRPDPTATHLGPADHTTITPLHWASNLGHDGCVRYLLMAGWNVNLRDMCGYTPLHYAVRSGSVAAVRLLLRAGARPDLKNDLAMTPLHGAILDGALEAAKLLLHAGANVNSRDINGQTALMFGAQSGRSPAAAIQLLLNFNANANCSDLNGETALSSAFRLYHAKPSSTSNKTKMILLLRASRPEIMRPLRWHAAVDVDPELVDLSRKVSTLERIAILRIRQLFASGYLPDKLTKCDLPVLIKNLLLLKC